MSLQSSKHDKEAKNPLTNTAITSIDTLEHTLRPVKLSEYIGQDLTKQHLSVSIASALKRNAPLEHILLYGPPGLGKTTLAGIIAHEMNAKLKITSGAAIEKQADLVSILSNLEKNDIFFIDEIHRLRPVVEEILYTAMEDGHVDIMVGKGTGAQSVRLPIVPFTLIGATTKLSALSNPLRDRFGNIIKLDFYSQDNMQEILENNAQKLRIPFSADLIQALSVRSRGTPRIANRLLKMMRDYATVGERITEKKVFENIFQKLGIDSHGLDYLDKKYLSILYEKFSGWPTGLATLAGSLGEEEATLEEVVEPYLLQIGFLEKSPRGRKITDQARIHLYERK